MHRSVVLSLACLATLAGCREAPESSTTVIQAAPFIKPIVTLVPVIDSTTKDWGWDLADEFTAALDYRLSCNENLFLTDLKKGVSLSNPFTTDLQWVKKRFPGQEFVVFLELLEHDEILRQDKKNPVEPHQCSADLQISMRVRVLDLRDSAPRIVLQEILSDAHFIPRAFTRLNFALPAWGQESFSISPVGLAHAAFMKTLSKRIEDYILLHCASRI